MLLGKSVLLQRPSLPTEDIELPEFGGTLRVRAWTGEDNDAFGKAAKACEFDGGMFAAAVAVSAINESGDRMFDMNGDVKRIAEAWPKPALERVWRVVSRMNSLTKAGAEEAEKN